MAHWAIVIGVNLYWRSEACLRGAVSDALKMREWLVSTKDNGGKVPASNLFLLLSPEPDCRLPPGVQAIDATQDNINETITLLLRRSGEEGERFFFYFSGHGLTHGTETGIIPTDFRDTLTTKALRIRSIYERFQATRFEKQFFFIDACRDILWEGQREFRISDISEVKAATPPVPPQFVMYATSPGLKAVEIDELKKERGAFTEALLKGLRGEGNSKVWNEDAEKYDVYWDNLCCYVESEVKKKQLNAGGNRIPPLIQEPRQYGERGSHNPLLASFPAKHFEEERLEVDLDPRTTAPQAEIVVGDMGGVLESKKEIDHLPVEFRLKPRRYSVRAEAPEHQMDKRYYGVDLYEPKTVLVKLVPGTAVPYGLVESNRRGITRGLKRSAKPGNLVVRSNDPLAQIEVADKMGKFLKANEGSLTCENLSPGFYLARVRGPEGDVSERLVEVWPDETEVVSVDSPKLPDTGLLTQVVQTAGIQVWPDNTIDPSEAVGPISSARLSTLLALGAGAANEETEYGSRLRSIGVRPFRKAVAPPPDSGLQILFGIESAAGVDVAEYLSGIKLRCWSDLDPVPAEFHHPVAFGDVPGLGQCEWAKEPGFRWLTIELPDRFPMIFATTILAKRLTLFVFHQDISGQVHIFQYFPSLVAGEPKDPRKDLVRFPMLQRSELIQRAHMSGRLDRPDGMNSVELRAGKWMEPVAACLHAEVLLNAGRPRAHIGFVKYLTRDFEALSDTHVLLGAYEERMEHESEADQAYRTALDRGLPVTSRALQLLVDGIQRRKIEHARADLAMRVFKTRIRDLLWSACSINELKQGELVLLI